jgi:hypothetical protein
MLFSVVEGSTKSIYSGNGVSLICRLHLSTVRFDEPHYRILGIPQEARDFHIPYSDDGGFAFRPDDLPQLESPPTNFCGGPDYLILWAGEIL